MTKSGLLRHRVVIQKPAEDQSTTGAVNRGWTDYLTVWARVRPLGTSAKAAQEFVDQDQIVHRFPVRFEIRYREGITQVMRIKFPTYGEPQYYRIERITNPAHRNKDLFIDAMEIHDPSAL